MRKWINIISEDQAGKRIVNFDELTKHFKEKYRIDLYDVNKGKGMTYDKWRKKKGYKGKDPDGKDAGSSQIWFAEYKKDPEGKALQAPYFNFWQWMLKQVGGSGSLNTTEHEHWQIFDLPSSDSIPEETEAQFQAKARYLQMAKNFGVDVDIPHAGTEEVRDIIRKIEADFGHGIQVYMSVSR